MLTARLMTTTTALLVSIILMTNNSCKKKDVTPATVKPKTRTELLTSKAWTLTDYKYTPVFQNMGTVTMNGCSADDLLTFRTDGNYIEETGPLRCSGETQQIKNTGRWIFSSDELTVRMVNDLTKETKDWQIVSMDSLKMTLQGKFTDGLAISNGVTYTVTMNYKH